MDLVTVITYPLVFCNSQQAQSNQCVIIPRSNHDIIAELSEANNRVLWAQQSQLAFIL